MLTPRTQINATPTLWNSHILWDSNLRWDWLTILAPTATWRTVPTWNLVWRTVPTNNLTPR